MAITDGNWGTSGNSPLQSLFADSKGATTPENNPGRRDNQVTPSSRYAAPNVQPKFGFEAYANHRLNQSGGQLIGRKGAGTVYDQGDFKGQTPGQAQEALRAEYEGMPDAQRQHWESTAQGNDIRSQREIAGNTQSATSPPYTASGATPTIPQTGANAADPNGAYGPNAEQNLSRLRAAGVVGDNQTISDPEKFKAAVAKLGPVPGSAAPTPTTVASAGPVTTPPAAAPAPGAKMGATVFDSTGLGVRGPVAPAAPATADGQGLLPTPTLSLNSGQPAPAATAPSVPPATASAPAAPAISPTTYAAPTPPTPSADGPGSIEDQMHTAASSSPAAVAAAQNASGTGPGGTLSPDRLAAANADLAKMGQPATMPTSTAGVGPADASGAKPVAPPPYSAPKTAGAGDDIDPATGKKRVTAGMA